MSSRSCLRLTHFILFFTTLVLVTACGGGGGGSSSVGSNQTSAALAGTASKGIISGGLVSAYPFIGDAPGNQAIATSITDSNGDYALTIPAQYSGQPIFIEISDNNGSASMKCDIAGGCDVDGDGSIDAAFGANINLGAGELNMSAMLASASGSVSVSITPLTTVAADLAKDSAAGISDSSSISSIINGANSKVANRFGIIGDVTKIKVIDLTNVDALAQASGDSAAIEYAAINAAIVSAVQSDQANTSINDAIKKFSAEYKTNGLTTNSIDVSLTDLGDVLEDARQVLDQTKDLLTPLGDDYANVVNTLNGVSNDMAEDETAANNEVASNVGDQGTASSTANADSLAKVKAFAEELRELGVAIDSTIIGEGNAAQSIASIRNNFKLQTEAADLVTSDDVNNNMDALGDALAAIVEVYAANFNEETGSLDPSLPTATITSLPGSTVWPETGITVNASIVNDDVIMSVNETILGANVEISVLVDSYIVSVDEFASDTGEAFQEQGSYSADIRLTVFGTVSGATSTLEINRASRAIVQASLENDENGTSDFTNNAYTRYETADIVINRIEITLDASLAQTVLASGQQGGLMHFDGAIGIELLNSRYQFSEDDEWGYGNASNNYNSYDKEIYQDTFTLGQIGLSIAGKFYNDLDSFEAMLRIEGDGKGQNFNGYFENIWEYDPQTGFSSTDIDSTYQEAQDNYVDLSVSLRFDADLNGVADAVTFDFDATRTGYSEATSVLELSYPGRSILINASTKGLADGEQYSASYKLINNDGVRVDITQVGSPPQELSGVITLDGVKYADLILTNTAVERIVYIDGTFESVF